MTTLRGIKTWLDDNLATVLSEYDVPGAAVAVYADGQIVDAAAGVLNRATGVQATADSLFQVGSITKLWTATLVMQLVDEGRLDLDAPIRTYLPDFELADADAAATLTTRQLLSHTAGFEGDIFTDTGPGDDCVQRYVASLSTDAQLFPPGERFSYNNAGFCVLGRLIEVLRDQPFDTCLTTHLFKPLGLTHAAAGAQDAIRYRAALGHLRPRPDAEPEPAPVWSMARSNGPAGACLAMRPSDLVTFARMHLDGGTAADGTRVLSAASVATMQQTQVHLPELSMMGDFWGLGWELFDLDGTRVIGHDGSTLGQAAFLRVIPEQRVAIAVLTNGGDAIGVYRTVLGHLLRELTGVELRPLPQPSATGKVDATRYLGTYSCEVTDYVVRQDDDGRVWLDETPKGLLLEMGAVAEHRELLAYSEDTLIVGQSSNGLYELCAFVGATDDGRALYLHNGRAARRA